MGSAVGVMQRWESKSQEFCLVLLNAFKLDTGYVPKELAALHCDVSAGHESMLQMFICYYVSHTVHISQVYFTQA